MIFDDGDGGDLWAWLGLRVGAGRPGYSFDFFDDAGTWPTGSDIVADAGPYAGGAEGATSSEAPLADIDHLTQVETAHGSSAANVEPRTYVFADSAGPTIASSDLLSAAEVLFGGAGGVTDPGLDLTLPAVLADAQPPLGAPDNPAQVIHAVAEVGLIIDPGEPVGRAVILVDSVPPAVETHVLHDVVPPPAETDALANSEHAPAADGPAVAKDPPASGPDPLPDARPPLTGHLPSSSTGGYAVGPLDLVPPTFGVPSDKPQSPAF